MCSTPTSLFLAAVTGVFLSFSSAMDGVRLPNIVLLLADDLGYGDLGCYGNDRVSTPNIDGLARDGLRFTRMYSECAGTPARAALLTGRYPVRFGMVRDARALPMLRSPGFHSLAQPGGLHDVEGPLLPTLLKSRGYNTGMVGRWGLGVGEQGRQLPHNLGFDVFYGTPGAHGPSCTSDVDSRFSDTDIVYSFGRKLFPVFVVLLVAMRFRFIRRPILKTLLIVNCVAITLYGTYLSFSTFNTKSCILMHNDKIIEQPYTDSNMTLRTTKKGLEFISASATGSQPIFLFVSYLQAHLPPIVSEKFRNRSGLGPYYDSVREMDWSVGKFIQKLKDLDIYDDTLIIFASDNGPEQMSGLTKSKLPDSMRGSTKFKRDVDLRGEKHTVWEGGIRVPAIFTWKKSVPQGQRSDVALTLRDILPTIMEIVFPEGDRGELDGESLIPIFKNVKLPSPHDFLMHYCDNSGVAAVTAKRHKVHFRACSGEEFDPPLAFDIVKDPGEAASLGSTERDKILEEVLKGLSLHNSSIVPYASQLSHVLRPWLYLCSNFPFCNQVLEHNETFESLFL